PARRPSCAVESQPAAVRSREEIGADRAGDRGFGTEPIFRRLVEQRQGADNDGLELSRLAVIGDVNPLAGLFILLRSTVEGEPFDVNEGACDLQPMTAAGMNADATILMLDANARCRIGGVLALIAEAVAHRGYGLATCAQTRQFLAFDAETHSRFHP